MEQARVVEDIQAPEFSFGNCLSVLIPQPNLFAEYMTGINHNGLERARGQSVQWRVLF